ncbi:adenosylhomocysteinase (plasmid) [Phaeobacter sp. BS23]|uniref:adenosylhomocysteinase n=1 Tax=Phaeobacter sp. BS23 TaxID=2907239 RepID=UPI003703AD2A
MPADCNLSNSDLIASGEKRIAWARAHMPILAGLKARFEKERPFEGLIIGICLHIEAKTGVWLDALTAGGARIVITGSPGSTQNDTLAALNAYENIRALGHRDETFEDHLTYCHQILEEEPDLIADNGADLHNLIAIDPKHAGLKATIRGATEETTTGGFRLREDMEPFGFATWIINDTEAKQIVENRYGVGSSVVDGLMRATNVMLHGKRIAVIGYGFCGSGVAMRLRGMGARVVVIDRDPMRQLEAHLEGFDTADLHDALAAAEVVITVTGREDVLDADALSRLRDGCILANAGHFATEINILALHDMAHDIVDIRDQIKQITLTDGRRIFLLSNGNLVNLAAGDGNPIEVMDLGLALQSLSLERLAKEGRDTEPGAHRVPYDIERLVAKLSLEAWT